MKSQSIRNLAITLLLQSYAAAHPHSAPEFENPKVLVSRKFEKRDVYQDWPSYDQLPLDPSYPTKAAWGVWGADVVQGALNHIMNETILAAASHIKLGMALNLKWYNDLIENYEEVIGPSPTSVLGIQQAAQKGIASRGVLLDWAGWAETQNISYSAFSGRGITADELDCVAAWQGLTPNWSLPGDMLLIRTGWTKGYRALTDYEQETIPWQPNLESIGMLSSYESLSWLWEKKLAFVGAENLAIESLPMDKTIGGVPRSLHQVFIGGWGQSIVEFLDPEKLAETLHGFGRSTFFLTIQNLNIVSGIASPPNALAIL